MRRIRPLGRHRLVEPDPEARPVGRKREALFVPGPLALEQVVPKRVLAAVTDLLDRETRRREVGVQRGHGADVALRIVRR